MIDSCGCFEPEPGVPGRRNRAGLSRLAYRIGTHPEVLERLLGDLGGSAALAALTTRERDDPSIALLDAFAVVADVLAFYQERIANEGFLATATERRSILELARLIGYELAPGVAAHVHLAFTVEDRGAVDDGHGIRCTIPAGTRVQSVPGQGELPQTFETSEEIVAYAELNELRTVATTAQAPSADDRIWLAGTATRLEAGDVVVIAPGAKDGVGTAGEPVARRVARVVVERAAACTRVELVPEDDELPVVDAFAATGLVMGSYGGLFATGSVSGAAVNAYASANGIPVGAISSHYAALAGGRREPEPNAPGVYAMRKSVGIFGHNAPQKRTVDGVTTGMDDGETIGAGAIELDSVVRAASPGSYVVVERGGARTVARVKRADEASVADYGVSARVTKLTLMGPDAASSAPDVSAYRRRETTVFAQAERLPLAERPDESPLHGPSLVLEGPPRFFLTAGRTVLISGEDHAKVGVVRTERRTLTTVDHSETNTAILLDRALDHGYRRATVRIAANVAHATHGETVTEVLGSGDGTAHQRFMLRRPPLTHVSAPTPSGARSTLEIRVDGVRWDPVDRLYVSDATAERYELARTDEGGTRLTFGDGRHGARVPTGTENVRASYRTGIGLAGMVGPRTLTLLQTRPLGVRDVVNPLPSAGAGEPESRDAARKAAPLTVRTLDRVVTVSDYEDFARAFAGVGKARATSVAAGSRPLVHLSVAAADGSPLEHESDTYRNLVDALTAASDPGVGVQVDGYQPVPFGIAATLLLDARHGSASVLGAVRDALAGHFGFARREFGQGVSISEVATVALAVAGAVDVRVTALGPVTVEQPEPSTVEDPLLAHNARVVAGAPIAPAQLLHVAAADIRLAERSA